MEVHVAVRDSKGERLVYHDQQDNTIERTHQLSLAQLTTYAGRLGLPVATGKLSDYRETVAGLLEHLDHLGEFDTAVSPAARRPPRMWRPTCAEDPLNSIVCFCEVNGAPSGPLARRRIGIKDNVAVAGLPMTNGGSRSPEIVPIEDAVVVERLLAAGADVTAKTNMADMAIGMGDSSAFGVCRNPHDSRYLAGGSSSGSAAAVSAGLVDLAIGTDQSGSVRVPAAWCGIVGLKPTHGLVPTHGTTYLDHTLDHVGPMTSTVEDNALMLEIIAGCDWRDPLGEHSEPEPFQYLDTVGEAVAGLRVGVVSEALAASGATPGVLKAFQGSREILAGLGAEVVDVSVPLWRASAAISAGVLCFGAAAAVDSFGQGAGHRGRIDLQSMVASVAQYRDSAADFPLVWRSILLAVEHLRRTSDGLHFGRAQNLRLELRRQVERAFDGVDLLITPTVPVEAALISDLYVDGQLDLARSNAVTGVATRNTSVFNLTGHPALTIPCGTGRTGLPVGLQLVGHWFGERVIYRAAFAFEQASR